MILERKSKNVMFTVSNAWNAVCFYDQADGELSSERSPTRAKTSQIDSAKVRDVPGHP